MFTRPLGMNVNDNPLLDSPFSQQDDIEDSYTPPPVGSFFLLSTNDNFLLSTGDKLLLSG